MIKLIPRSVHYEPCADAEILKTEIKKNPHWNSGKTSCNPHWNLGKTGKIMNAV